MWLATLLALTLGATTARQELDEPTPFEASLSFHTELGPAGAALGGKLHLGISTLSPRPRIAGSSPYLSVGVEGSYAQAALEGCRPDLCVARGSLGPTLRLGWAWWSDAQRDHSLYLQLAGGVAWENLPAAPLSPGATGAAPFASVGVGWSSPWFTRAFSHRLFERASDWRFWLITLLPLALLDHLELGVGWSGAALTPAGPRFSVGAGFGF